MFGRNLSVNKNHQNSLGDQAICNPKYIWNFLFSLHCAFFQVGFGLLLSIAEVHYFCVLLFHCFCLMSSGKDWSSFVLIVA